MAVRDTSPLPPPRSGAARPSSAPAGDPLQALTDAALSYADPFGVLHTVASRILETFAADAAVLLVADPTGRYLEVRAAAGVLEKELEAGMRIEVGTGVAGRIAAERHAVAIPDVKQVAGASRVLQRHITSLLGAPLVVDDKLIGVLHVGSAKARPFTSDESGALQDLADRLALALDHARLYRAERAARSDAARAERRFRDLVHNLDAIVFESDAHDWRFTFVNRRAEKIVGYVIEDWLRTPDFWLKMVHPQDRAEVVRRRREMLEKGRRASFEFRVLSAEGRTLWMRGMFDVVRDTSGLPVQVQGLMLDITQRRQAESEALRLAAIVEGSEDAIIGKDMNGAIHSWNQGATRMYQYTPAEAIGQHIGMLSPPHRRHEIDEIMARVRAGQHITHFETQRVRKNGEMIEVSLTISPIRDAAGNLIGASTIAREITDMKRAEKTLRATEKLAATGRLAASIAHEINNPMASVTNLLYLLQHHSTLDHTAKEYVKLAQEELNRVTHIVRQMLGFYRESETTVEVSLKDVVENVLMLYARRLQTTRIAVQREYRSSAAVKGYPGEIRQVFSNLIVNAIEAMGENGRLRIVVHDGCDWTNPQVRGVRVIIGDTGPGIRDEVRRHIFEPFFTTKGERGTGLGLWVSHGIVRKHGGTLRLRSKTGGERHGTCFSIFLPFDPPEDGARREQ